MVEEKKEILSKEILTNRDYLKSVREASSEIIKTIGRAEIALILGTGLAEMAEGFEEVKEMKYSSVPHLPTSTAPGHMGRLITATYKSKRLLIWSGRLHKYEGYTGYQLNIIAHISAFVGTQFFILTNAAGGLDKAMAPGNISLATGFYNDGGYSPTLPVCNDRHFGPKLFNPCEHFPGEVLDMAREAAREVGVRLFEGDYVWMTGPCYESIPEVEFMWKTGAAAVGMSTIYEFYSAAALGMQPLALSMVTDVPDFGRLTPLTAEEIISAATKAVPTMKKIILGVLDRIELSEERDFRIQSLITIEEEKQDIPYYLETPKLATCPTVMDCKGAALQISELAKTLGLNKFTHSYSLSNRCTLSQLQKLGYFVENSITIKLSEILDMPNYSYGMLKAQLIIGKGAKGEGILVVTDLPIEGIFPIESCFLAKLFRELNVPNHFACVEACPTVPEAYALGEIVLVKDFTERRYGESVDSNVLPIMPLINQKIEQIILPLVNAKSALLMGFPGPAFPSASDKQFNILVNHALWTNHSLSFIEHMISEGIPTITLAELTRIPRDRDEFKPPLFELLFNSIRIKAPELNIYEAEYRKAVGQFEQMKMSQGMAIIKAMINDAPMVDIPYDGGKAGVENAAAVIKEVFGDIPEKAILISPYGFSAMKDLCVFEKAVNLKGNFPFNQKPPSIYIGKIKGSEERYIFPDNLLLGEAHLPENYPIVPIRILRLIGVKKFMIITEVYTGEPKNIGDVLIYNNYMPYTGTNPLIGPNQEDWGVRFQDVMQIYNKKTNENLKAKIGEKLPEGAKCTIGDVIWINSIKSYIGEADFQTILALQLDGISHRGIMETICIHHMGGTVNCIGIVSLTPGKRFDILKAQSPIPAIIQVLAQLQDF